MKAALSIVLTVAFSTMSVVACGSDTPTENGLTDVASVAVTPTNATLVSFVETAQFTATAKDAAGNVISDKAFTWTTSNPGVVTVSSTGLSSAVANGSATIRATTDGVNGTATVAVSLSCGPPGMISWWPGNGNPSDVIGPNEATLVNGATFASGKVGQAFSFDGVDDKTEAGATGINDLQQLTIDAWVMHESLPPQIERYVTIDGASEAVLRHDGGNGPNQLHFFMRIGGVLRHVRVNNVLQVGVFHHVAGTYNGSVMRLFLDGMEVGNLTVSGTVGGATGVEFSSSGEALDGLLDEIAIYDRALTTAEIQAIFDAGSAGKCGV